MSPIKHIRRYERRQTLSVFVTQLLIVGATAGAAFIFGHGLAIDRSIVSIVFVVLAWSVVAAWEFSIQPVQPRTIESEDTRWRHVALVTLLALPGIAAFDAEWSVVKFAAGAMLTVLGGALRVWSLASLGPQFTWTAGLTATHRYVQTGPYRYYKHPNYAGSVVFATGIVLCMGSLVGWAAVALLAVSVFFAAKHEEAFLREKLPGYR